MEITGVPSPPPRRLRELSELLHASHDELLREWLEAAGRTTPAGDLPEPELRDHMPMLLERFARGLPGVAAGEEPTAEPAGSYALSRMAESVELPDCLRELQLLRAVVTRRWWQVRSGADDLAEALLLGRALDDVVRQVCEAYLTTRFEALQALDRLATTGLEELPLQESLTRLLKVVVEGVSAVDTAAVFLLEGERLTLRAVVGLCEDEVGRLQVGLGEGLVGRVALRRAAEHSRSGGAAPEAPTDCSRAREVRALYGVPLACGERLVGVATVGSLTEYSFSALTEQLVRALAERAGNVIAYRQEQEERQRLHRELEAVVGSMRDGLLFYAPGGRVERANPASASLLGFDARGLERAELVRRIRPTDLDGRPLSAEQMPSARALRGGRPVEVRFRACGAGGRPLLVVGSASPVTVGGVAVGVVAVWRDDSERERLIEERERERSLLREVIADAPMGIGVLEGEALRVREANRLFVESVPEPFRSEGVVGRTVEEFIAGAREAGLLEVMRRVQRGAEPWMHPAFPLWHPDRGDTWWRAAISRLGAPGPRAEIIIAVADVTDHERARRRVEEDRLRLKAILETLPAGVIVADAEGRIAECNDQARRIWGGTLPPLAEPTKEPWGWRVPDGRPVNADERPLARALRRGVTSAGELIEIDCADGVRRCTLNGSAPIRDEAGRITGAVAVVLDVTEQRRLSLELERQRAELDAVFESIPDALLVFDAAGVIVRTNAAADALMPYDAEELRLTQLERLALRRIRAPDGGEIDPERSPFRRALRGEVVNGELVLIERPARPKVWAATSTAPIRLGSGELLGAVATVVDVTHLQEMKRQLEDMVAMLSHDLRTPLATVSMQAQMLSRSAGSPEVVLRRAHAISTSAHRMNTMIQDLVDVAKLETGRYQLNLAPVDVRAYALELDERLAGVLDTRRIRVEAPPGLPPILADPDRLERIVVNLLSNALKYSPEGSEVRLEAGVVEGGVALRVKDRGQGIPPDELSRIFERYYRTQKGGRIEGLGLGLYITRLLVEAHGARISAESEVGKGSAFTVVFPAAR